MVRAISDNNDPATHLPGRFSPSQATNTLPLVRRIVADLIQLHRVISAQTDQIRGIDQLSETINRESYREELSDIRDSLASDQQRWQACFDELAAIGVQVSLPFDGSVDFPAVMNRRPVCLSWHPEDGRVEHWRELGESFDERKKLDAASLNALSGR